MLVVLEADVEEGLVPLDQRRFQVQRLPRVLRDDVLEVMDLLYQRQQGAGLSTVEADRQVWRRLAA